MSENPNFPNRENNLPVPGRKYPQDDPQGRRYTEILMPALEELNANALVSGPDRSEFEPMDGTLYVPTQATESWAIGTGNSWIKLPHLGPHIQAESIDLGNGPINKLDGSDLEIDSTGALRWVDPSEGGFTDGSDHEHSSTGDGGNRLLPGQVGTQTKPVGSAVIEDLEATIAEIVDARIDQLDLGDSTGLSESSDGRVDVTSSSQTSTFPAIEVTESADISGDFNAQLPLSTDPQTVSPSLTHRTDAMGSSFERTVGVEITLDGTKSNLCPMDRSGLMIVAAQGMNHPRAWTDMLLVSNRTNFSVFGSEERGGNGALPPDRTYGRDSGTGMLHVIADDENDTKYRVICKYLGVVFGSGGP